jgi:hypothetical protein
MNKEFKNYSRNMNRRRCECCEEEIDARQSFECDDEEIFEAVISKTKQRNLCIECALTSAVIEQT